MMTNYSQMEFSAYETPTCNMVNVNPESVLCASAGATTDPYEEVDWTTI